MDDNTKPPGEPNDEANQKSEGLGEETLPPSQPPQQGAERSPTKISILLSLLKEWSPRWKTAWYLFGEAVMVLWAIALWDSYHPKITITPGGTLNQKNPFATVFIIQNQGDLTISQINYRSQLTLVPIPGTSFPKVVAQEQNVSVISQLGSLETYSFSIHYGMLKINESVPGVTNLASALAFMTNQIPAPNQASMAGQIIPNAILLEFDVTYKPKFFRKRTNKLCFFAVQDTDQNWQWLPSGHENVIDQTIDTNLVAQAQKMSPITVIQTVTPTNGGTQVHAN